MPVKSQGITVTYFAEDVSSGGGKAGDGANHSLRRIVDGMASAITASPVEIDATNLPGLYKVALTGAENNGVMMAVAGKSSTADVVLRGVQWTNEHNVSGVNDDLAAAANLESACDNYSSQAGLAGSNLDAAVSSRSSHNAPDIWSHGSRSVTDKAGFSLTTTAYQAIRDTTWNAILSSLSTAGSIGNALRLALTGVTSQVAQKLDVDGLANFSTVSWNMLPMLERVDSGSKDLQITIYVYDPQTLALKEADSTPTVTITDGDGTGDRSSEFSLSAVSNPSTGVYTFTITNTTSLVLEPAQFKATVVVDGLTFHKDQLVDIVDASVVGYTSADRSRDDNVATSVASIESEQANLSPKINNINTNVGHLVPLTFTAGGVSDTTTLDISSLNFLAGDLFVGGVVKVDYGFGTVEFAIITAHDNTAETFTIEPVLSMTPIGASCAVLTAAGLMTAAERTAIASEHLDTQEIETGVSVRKAQRAQLSESAGKLSGAATTNVRIRDVNDTKDRIDAIVDEDGNRTTVVLDLD